jgi:hypothetical protein
MIAVKPKRQFAIVVAFTILSWLGMMIHNAVELPQLTLLSPEVGIPTLIYGVLALGWRFLPYKRLTASLLFGWALLHLLGGGIITVIPFSFLPFYPEQSLRHYFAHLIYSVAQLPLLVLSFQAVRRS